MSIFGQVWVFSAIAFVLGAFLAWVFLVRPARKQVRDLEARLAAREADLRRISEPALGASDAASARASRNDPFSDADEALAAGGASTGAAYDAPGTRQLEPETDWPERDSLAGIGGDHAGYGAHGDAYDDFDLADRPEDLEERGAFEEHPGDERGAFDEQAFDDRGVFDDRSAFDDRGVFDDAERGAGADLRGESDEDIDAAFDAADDEYAGRDYSAYGGDGVEESEAEQTRYVAPLADPEPVAGVSSALDPDETRSGPHDQQSAETTQLIGRDSLPQPDGRADAELPGDGAEQRPGSSALNMGPPFKPVTSFEATTEFPVGAAQAAGAAEQSQQFEQSQPFEQPQPFEEPEPFEDVQSEARSDGPPAKRPGSLFEPGAVDDADEPGAGDLAGAESGVESGAAGSAVDSAPAESGDVADAEPPAYAFGGGPADGDDEDPAESTNILPKRTPRQRPPGGFDAPKPIQPSMRAITRREPDADVQSGSLFEPSASSSGGGEPAAEPVEDQQAGQGSEMTAFVTPAGQVPAGGRHGTLDEPPADPQDGPVQDGGVQDSGVQGGGAQGGGAQNGRVHDGGAQDGGAQDGGAQDEDLQAGPFGPGSAMPLPGGGSPSPDFTVKASVTALRYVTDASPQYPRMVAEVWFRSPGDAERVGFRPLG